MRRWIALAIALVGFATSAVGLHLILRWESDDKALFGAANVIGGIMVMSFVVALFPKEEK